jgi:hypothetical protein
MSERPHVVRRILLCTIRNVLFLLIAALGAILLYANVSGVPEPVSRRILDRLNGGDFAVDIGEAKLKGLLHVQVERVSLFRKGVIGDPLFRAGRVQLTLSPRAWIRGDSALTAIHIQDAVWLPEQGRSECSSSSSSSSGGMQRPLRFKVVLDRCLVRDIMLEEAAFLLVGTRQALEITEYEASVSQGLFEGSMSGQLSYDCAERVLSARFVTNFDPHILQPLCQKGGLVFCEELIKRFRFDGEPPRGEWGFDYHMSGEGSIHVTGDFRMRDCAYRDVDLLRADGSITVDLHEAGLDIDMHNLFLVRREGMASLAFSVDPQEKLVEFNVDSSIEPLAAWRMVGILTNLFSQHIVFDGAATYVGGGVVDYSETYAATDLKAVIEADHVNVWPIGCDRGSLNLRMLGRSLSLTNINAHVNGGATSGDVLLTIPVRDKTAFSMPYRVNVKSRDVDFERFMASVVKTDAKREYQGRLSGSLLLDGCYGDDHLKSLNGEGSVYVRDGRVFLLPLFGGFSRFMTRIIPGLDFVLRQSDLNTDFTIEDGLIESRKVAVEGGVLSLKGDGSCQIGGDLDFDVQVKLMKEHTLVAKLLRVITYPISKLFEFRLRGPLSDPHWYPVNFSLDLLERIGLRKRDAGEDSEDNDDDSEDSAETTLPDEGAEDSDTIDESEDGE